MSVLRNGLKVLKYSSHKRGNRTAIVYVKELMAQGYYHWASICINVREHIWFLWDSYELPFIICHWVCQSVAATAHEHLPLEFPPNRRGLGGGNSW